MKGIPAQCKSETKDTRFGFGSGVRKELSSKKIVESGSVRKKRKVRRESHEIRAKKSKGGQQEQRKNGCKLNGENWGKVNQGSALGGVEAKGKKAYSEGEDAKKNRVDKGETQKAKGRGVSKNRHGKTGFKKL